MACSEEGGTRDASVVFIVGSPRSGSTWLQLMLGAHPQVCTSIEVTVYDRYIGPLIRAWNAEAACPSRPGLSDQWSEHDFYAFLKSFIARTYQPIWATNPSATHLVDKRPANTEYILEISRLIPGARFIHIVRDGRDVMASLLAAARDLQFATDTAEKAARKWREKVQQAQVGRALGDCFTEVRYEDLLADPQRCMRSLFTFCGLAIDDATLAEIVRTHAFEILQQTRKSATTGYNMPAHFYRRGQAGSWRDELSQAELEVFDALAGPLNRSLGYDTEEASS